MRDPYTKDHRKFLHQTTDNILMIFLYSVVETYHIISFAELLSTVIKFMVCQILMHIWYTHKFYKQCETI